MSIGSHHSGKSGTDTWLTPPEIIEALGKFDLDPCGYPGWPTAEHMFTEEDDGLSQEWFGRVWCNPPYSQPAIRYWMKRMAEYNLGTALIFARTETGQFDSVWGHAMAVMFLSKRIHFYYPDGTRAQENAGGPSVLIAYGGEDRDRLAESGLEGAFQLLQNMFYAVVQIPRTWAEAIETAMRAGALSLDDLYSSLKNHPKAYANKHWREKIRQELQRRPQFKRIARGTYTLQPTQA